MSTGPWSEESKQRLKENHWRHKKVVAIKPPVMPVVVVNKQADAAHLLDTAALADCLKSVLEPWLRRGKKLNAELIAEVIAINYDALVSA